MSSTSTMVASSESHWDPVWCLKSTHNDLIDVGQTKLPSIHDFWHKQLPIVVVKVPSFRFGSKISIENKTRLNTWIFVDFVHQNGGFLPFEIKLNWRRFFHKPLPNSFEKFRPLVVFEKHTIFGKQNFRIFVINHCL